MGGPFKIVLASLERRVGPEVLGNPTADRVVRELARMFALDNDTSRSIVSACPIVLVDGLDGHSAQVLRDRLRVLTDLGCKLIVTDDIADTMPRIDWPELPPVARVDPPQHGHAHGRNGSASGLQCPGCGLLLQLVRADAQGPPARDAAGARALPGGGAVERDAPPLPPPPTREPMRALPPPAGVTPAGMDDDADWLAPPTPAATHARSSKPPTSPSGGGGRGTGRFDDPVLMSRNQPAAPPPPPVVDTLKVAFSPPSDLGSISGLGDLEDELDMLEGGPSQLGPADASEDPLELIEDSRAEVNLEERRSQRKRASSAPSRQELEPFPSGSSRLPAGMDMDSDLGPSPDDPFGSSARPGEASSRMGFGGDQPFPVASPFEESGNIESLSDSASDLLGPPPVRGAAQPSSAARSGFDSDLDLFESEGDDPLAASAPPPTRAKGAPARSSESLDDLLLDDEESSPPPPAVRDRKRAAKASSRPELPDLESSNDPGLDDVLRMFGPEDEEPLDDLGLDPAPPDLGRGSGGGRAPAKGGKAGRARQVDFGGDMSDILEPLDPDEAIKIMKGQKPAPVRSGRSSTASNIRLDGSAEAGATGFDEGSAAGLEPLDPSEAFAILAADTKDKGRASAKKSRGVPYPATDEDVSLFEDSSAPRRPASNKNKTDPFARARRGGGGGGGRDEPEPRKSERSEKAREPRKSERSERAEPRKSERSEKAPSRRRSAAPPPGNEDGEHGLVLSRIGDPEKKEQAAELISQIKGCSIDEARKLTDRTIIPVLKGVSRELAEHHLERFKEFDIAGRVTTRQRG